MGRYIAALLEALSQSSAVRVRPLFQTAGRLRAPLKKLPGAYVLADALRAIALERERLRGLGVYHETNHAAPPFRGPFVLTVHDLSTVLHPQTQEPARARHFARALHSRAREAERIIVPTRAIADECKRHLAIDAARLRVIPHGVDARFTPDGTARGDAVLYVGDAGPRKGLDTLREAAAQFIHAGPPDNFVSDDELLRLYRSAAVLVLPSLYEGFGLPLLEAMACGTPCIASDDPALVEVSGGAALHFARGDAAALRKVLTSVLGDPVLRDDLSRRGVERARAFRWSDAAARHAEAYLEAAQR